jgi:DNA-binding PadR family transcriptional regulator
MTAIERAARKDAKRRLLLDFLASGEVYTTTEIASVIMSASRPVATSTLKSMEREGVLKAESHMNGGRQVRIWGITPHGLALANVFEDVPFFELGRTNSDYIPHHLQSQRARLAAEEAGWTDWTPGKTLYGQGLKKIPDAVSTSPDGKRVALEIERFIKTPKRYAEIISSYLQEIKSGKWNEVHYLTPPGLETRLERAFASVKFVSVAGNKVALTDRHRSVFKFFSFDNWPERR